MSMPWQGWILLRRKEGGEIMVPESELGIVSTALLADGTTDETAALVHVKCIDTNIVVDHTLHEIAQLIADAARSARSAHLPSLQTPTFPAAR